MLRIILPVLLSSVHATGARLYSTDIQTHRRTRAGPTTLPDPPKKSVNNACRQPVPCGPTKATARVHNRTEINSYSVLEALAKLGLTRNAVILHPLDLVFSDEGC